MRRCLPGETKTDDNEGGDDVSSSPASGKKSPPSGAGRSRALGLGLGESGLGGGDSGWEEAEPTNFVYTGLFPHEVGRSESDTGYLPGGWEGGCLFRWGMGRVLSSL